MPEGSPIVSATLQQAGIDQCHIGNVSLRPPRSAGRVVENARAVSYENDGRYAPDSRPAGAYAPADPRGPSELLAGRGLY